MKKWSENSQLQIAALVLLVIAGAGYIAYDTLEEKKEEAVQEAFRRGQSSIYDKVYYEGFARSTFQEGEHKGDFFVLYGQIVESGSVETASTETSSTETSSKAVANEE